MPTPPPPDFARVMAELRKAMGAFGRAGSLPYIGGLMAFIGYSLYKSMYFVPGGFRAVKFNAITGLQNRCYGEGANLLIPYIETPILFDIRNQPTEVTSSSGSRDLQIINMAVRVLFKPNPDQLHNIYRNLGVNYSETVLPSLINEIIKSVIAQFNASELLTKRPLVSKTIAADLRTRAGQFGIDISDVSITQMLFGKEYANAVEAKQIAQQMAERAKFRVELAEQEKRGVIILAEGEAESAKLIGEAIQQTPSFIDLRRIEAARSIAETIGHGAGKYYIDSSALMLNIQAAGNSSSKVPLRK